MRMAQLLPPSTVFRMDEFWLPAKPNREFRKVIQLRDTGQVNDIDELESVCGIRPFDRPIGWGLSHCHWLWPKAMG
jgi:hypothetical protein